MFKSDIINFTFFLLLVLIAILVALWLTLKVIEMQNRKEYKKYATRTHQKCDDIEEHANRIEQEIKASMESVAYLPPNERQAIEAKFKEALEKVAETRKTIGELRKQYPIAS